MRGSKSLRTREGHKRESTTQKNKTKLSRVVKTYMKYYRWKNKKKMKPNPWISRKKEKRAVLVKKKQHLSGKLKESS